MFYANLPIVAGWICKKNEEHSIRWVHGWEKHIAVEIECIDGKWITSSREERLGVLTVIARCAVLDSAIDAAETYMEDLGERIAQASLWTDTQERGFASA
jgi:hypothetical protein